MALNVTSAVENLTGSGTTATSATLDTTGAVTLVFAIQFSSTTPSSISWSDNMGNTTANATQVQNDSTFAAVRTQVWYWPVTSVGAGHTVTATWTGAAIAEILFGAITASNPTVVDQSTIWNFDTGGVPPFDCASVTTTVANSIVIGGYVSALTSTDTTIAPKSGYTVWKNKENGSCAQIALIYQIVAATGTYTPGLSLTNNTGNCTGTTINFYEGAPSSSTSVYYLHA